MSKFLSGRQSNLKLGVAGYTESKTVLETTGKVGIGTTDAQSSSLFVVGDTNFKGNVDLGDNDRLSFGDSQDLQIFHAGGASIIKDQGNGSLSLRGDDVNIKNAGGGEFKAKFLTNGAVELYYDNSKKFETTGIGVSIYNDLNVGTGVTIYGNAGIVRCNCFLW